MSYLHLIPNEYWSWLLAFVGVAGHWIVGSKNQLGWAVLVLNQLMWTAYAVATKQYGFLLSVVLHTIVYVRNYRKWRNL